jgi:hypothetical protein
MAADFAEFSLRLTAVLQRFYAQNSRPPLPHATIATVAQRLWLLMQERGPVQARDGELSADEAQTLTARVLADFSDELLAIAARQLVKTCLQPSPATCRNSYREVTADGRCRRQDIGRVRTRISGSHCVDCPYWQELDADDHAALLAQHWQGADSREFAAHREIFLPEDYRVLRRLALLRR